MHYLLFSVLSALLLNILFKQFAKHQINIFQAIVINYFICFATGSAFLGEMPVSTEFVSKTWFPSTIILGFLFLGGFYCSAMTVKHFGIAIASVIQRMTLLISVPFAIVFLSEPIGLSKGTGLFLALVAVICTNVPSRKYAKTAEMQHQSSLAWFFPIAVFLCGGTIECLLQYHQTHTIANEREMAVFSIYSFSMAGCIGVCCLLGQLLLRKTQLAWRNVVAGLILGAPNYFDIFFLLQSFSVIDKSIALPAKNIGVLAIAALLGFFFFRERLSPLNWIGILAATVAIGLIALG